MPRLSVIMASFNHATFVREAIDSVLTQSYQDLELVITDDGSTDGTADVIRGLSDPRLKFQAFAKNRGACVAVNDAIGRAQGEYVAVLNSDDYFLPGKLERQVAFLDQHPEIGAVFGQPLFVDEHGQPFLNSRHAFASVFVVENRSRTDWLKQFFQQGNCLCHPTILLRKSCYEKVGRFDPLLMQLPDLDLWIRLCQEYDIHILPEQVTAFRILAHERNTSAPSREKLARTAWETAGVLGHYSSLPEEILRKILGDSPAAAAGLPVKMQLALAAIRIGRPGYAAFGLALLRDTLRAGEAAQLAYTDYFKLVGEQDPLGAEFFKREYQFLKTSRVWRQLRKLAHWRRSHNFHG